MPLNDATLTIPGLGYIYSAPPGTTRPVNVVNPAAPWVDNGHTDEDSGLEIKFEIKTTKHRTWRARSGVRVSVDEVNFTLSWTALQVDNDTLAAYFGGGDASKAGMFGVSKSPNLIERALFIRLVDGDHEVDLHVARAAVGPASQIKANPKGFAGFPLQAEVLDQASAASLADWLAPHLGTPAAPAAP